MKIAAGVLLIVAAIFNAIAGCGWAGAGTCAGCVGQVLEQDRLQQDDQWSQKDEPIEADPNKGKTGKIIANTGQIERNDSILDERSRNDEEFEEFEPPSQETIEQFKTSGAGMALYGFAIMILSGVMLGAAVCSFKAKRANFVLITGILVIAAEFTGALLVYFILPEQEAEDILSGVALLFKLPGLLAGAFSILAAASFPHPLLNS